MPTLGTIYNASTLGSPAGTLTSGNGYASITLSPGIYITSFSFVLNSSGVLVGSYTDINVTTGTATLARTNVVVAGSPSNSTSFIIHGSFSARVTATATLTALLYFSGVTGVTSGIGNFWQAIRIG